MELQEHAQEHSLPAGERRARFLRRYLEALESGDEQRLALLLQEAEADAGLEELLLETNAALAAEDGLTVTATEGEEAHRRLEQVVRRSQPAQASLARAGSLLGETGPRVRPVQVPQGRRVPVRQVLRRSWMLIAAAVLLVVLFVVGSSTGLAATLLSFFSVQRFQPVSVSQQTIQAAQLPQLRDLGELQTTPTLLRLERHLTRAQAEQLAGFTLKLPTNLPASFSGRQPAFDVLEGGQATFTFRAASARAYLTRIGHANIAIPPQLDGATFVIHVSRIVETHYVSSGGKLLVIVQGPSPTIEATGKASLEDLRNFLLSLPGLPPSLVQQLRQIDLRSGTVPIPVLAGMSSQTVTVQGQSGLLLTSDQLESSSKMTNLPVGEAVLWQAQGRVYLLGESGHDQNELLSVANSLQ
ncbi:hypothetical protein KTAU_03450 [Thermogemmatispora aurantia]|uniref:DUF4367 domain-containing protein n=1 Tax=Thermogemmatispora aurantia TaxID=2045279 RepID=A0A5J4K4Q6_9CHLR|nr:hypothetical protein [Thermogemmatispora aurantia]GER81707.1 hypothetical protein KTAU_03450 [Thermogemmatispora aurantia]